MSQHRTTPQWLEWSQRLQAIAQTGLAYALNDYDRERFTAVREIASEIMGAHAGLDPAHVADLFGQDGGYATPKVDVRGAVFDSGRVLLVREVEDGRWTLPGGWADVGQSAAECVEREVREESGYEVRAVKLVAVLDRQKHAHPPIAFHAYKLFFVCDLLGGSPRASIETSEVGFFALDSLPPLSLGRVLPEQIALMWEHRLKPSLPTVFE